MLAAATSSPALSAHLGPHLRPHPAAVFDAADPSVASTFDHVTVREDPFRESQRQQLLDELGGDTP